MDYFHLVQLANRALTELRRRLTGARRKRRGRKGDPEWDLRRLLLRNAEDLAGAKRNRLVDTLTGLGPDGCTLLGGWIVKEKVRDLRFDHSCARNSAQELWRRTCAARRGAASVVTEKGAETANEEQLRLAQAQYRAGA